MSLTLWGHTLSDKLIKHIVEVSKKLNTPPSYAITLFHYEGLWGSSSVAKNNNNWGGMTWGKKGSAPYKRPSGVTVSRGTPRPSGEGGYYIKYASVEDYITDWSYLMRRGGIYRVADSNTFDKAVKGMFVVGGANYDYAIMGVNNSKARYEKYLANMKARRKAINDGNNKELDKLDSEEFEFTEDFPDNVDLVIRDIETLYGSIKNEFNNLQNKIFDSVMDSLKVKLYDLSSEKFGNKYIQVDKLLDNMYILKPNLSFIEDITGAISGSDKSLSDFNTDLKDIINKGNNHKADTPEDPNIHGKRPAHPTPPGLRITSKYGYRGNIGVSGASKYHKGIDIGGGGKHHPIYATQAGEVLRVAYSNSGGNMIFLKHTGDKYYSCYMHLKDKGKVKEGEKVKKGQEIGTMGSTGYSSGIHLHFGVSKNGDYSNMDNTINPEEYLKMEF